MGKATPVGRAKVALAAGLAGLAGLQPAAMVRDLRPALLRASDVPPGFVHARTAVVTRFAPVLHSEYFNPRTVTTLDSACIAPASLTRNGGTQTAIRTFFGSGDRQYQFCGWLFASMSNGGRAYRAIRAMLGREIPVSSVVRLPGPRVGTASLLLASRGTAPAVYVGLFQHDNAVIELSYQGPRSYPTATFTAVIRRVNARLDTYPHTG